MNNKEVLNLWNDNYIKFNESMHLYIHVPFCVEVCGYCMYKSTNMYETTKNSYDSYFEGLKNQLRGFKDVMQKNPANSIYFGGGTPSIMPFEVLKEISEIIPHWNEIKVKVFEANPASMTKDKIDTLVELGFTYLALGVQTLDKEELKNQNRKIPKDGHLKEITHYAVNKGLHVNYDIMTLLNDDLEVDMNRIYKDLRDIMNEYKPQSIDIYPMDQKLRNVDDQGILIKIKSLRKIIKKALFFNRDYHVASGIKKLDITDDSKILNNYFENYHLLNIPDEVYFGERKAYSCSGPSSAPKSQNVLSFGGYKDSWVYSYAGNKRFVYFSQLNDKGEVIYRKERV